jgi:4-aminobutyrate aminotransferase/(S)-3-amino-2-methylpropionate transaminase
LVQPKQHRLEPLFSHDSSQGYNHPKILAALRDERNVKAMANRPALGWFPSEDWVHRVRDSMMAVAPPGTSQVFPMMCGTCSNENGIKLMFMR